MNIYHMEKYIKDELNPLLWENFKLKPAVRRRLLKLSKAFYDVNEMTIKVHDVQIVGSSANYNYHKGSDIDLHLIINFDDISKDKTLVDDYIRQIKKVWGAEHHIQIEGIDVEISVIDIHATDIKSGGIYSILQDQWIKKPLRQDLPEKNFEKRDKLADIFAKKVAILETNYKLQKYPLPVLYQQAKNIWKQIKDLRKIGLANTGEMDSSNLAFKKLRDIGIIQKCVDLKNQIFDEYYSED